MLRLSGVGCDVHVNFKTETTDGLVLCPSNPSDSNFIIDNEGSVWAINFGHMCFLPPSFISYLLTMSRNVFADSIACCVNYPQSANFEAMSGASGQLVNFDNNVYGK